MMPKMDGYAFTRALREVQNTLPILMVSAKQAPASRKEGFVAGIDDYMTKPVDEEEMLLTHQGASCAGRRSPPSAASRSARYAWITTAAP